MQKNKNRNVLLESFDKLKKHPKFTFFGVTVPVTRPYDIKAEPSKIKFGEMGKLPHLRYVNKKKRTYFSEVTGENSIYQPVVYEEDIDSQPLPERMVGEKTSHKHGKTDSHYVGELWLTVHKYTQRMGGGSPTVDVDGNVIPVKRYDVPNKMGGMASINCAASGTDFCQQNREKAVRHNARIKEANKQLVRLEKKLYKLTQKENPNMNEVDEMRKEFEILSNFLSHAKYHICGFCYANKAETASPKAGKITPKYKAQGDYLRDSIIPREKLPIFNPGEVIRLDAHGDLELGEKGVTQLINYLNIVQHNPHTYFTLWTKNHKTVNETYTRLGGVVKPRNLTIIYSNPWIDKPIFVPPSMAMWADGVFNVVYLDHYTRTKDGYVNIGGRKILIVKCKRLCRECKVCYSGMKNFAIVELEKNVGSKNPHAYDRKIKKTRLVRKPRLSIRDYIPMPSKFKA